MNPPEICQWFKRKKLTEQISQLQLRMVRSVVLFTQSLMSFLNKCLHLSSTQIITAILVSWLLCFVFTVTDVFPPEVDKYGFYARTDARQGILAAAPWFKIPYPCKCINNWCRRRWRRKDLLEKTADIYTSIQPTVCSLVCGKVCVKLFSLIIRQYQKIYVLFNSTQNCCFAALHFLVYEQ